MRKIKYRVLVVYFLVLFIIIELISRAVLFKICSIDPPKVDCSNCWRILWVRRHIEKGKNKFNEEDLYYYIFDRTKGWNLKPGLKHCLLSDGTIMSTNSQGLREEKEYPYDKTYGKKRIVIIGDSFAMGSLNNDHEISPAYLSMMLPSAEILNLGVGGYGHDQILLKLKQEGVKYNPDIVILLYMPCDDHRNILTFRDYAKPRYVLKGNRLMLIKSPVDTPENLIKKEKFNIYLIDLLGILIYKIKEKTGIIQKEEEALTEAIIKEMKNVCTGINAKFVIVSLADGDSNKFITQKLAKEKIIFLPVDKSNSLPDAFSEHWKPSGHKLVAEEICAGLLNNKLITRGETRKAPN